MTVRPIPTSAKAASSDRVDRQRGAVAVAVPHAAMGHLGGKHVSRNPAEVVADGAPTHLAVHEGPQPRNDAPSRFSNTDCFAPIHEKGI